MLDEDREAIRALKEDFERLADLTENDFKNASTFGRQMNHYYTVYTAATRSGTKTSEFPGYDTGELLYMDFQEMLTRYLLRHRDIDRATETETFQEVLRIWDHYMILMKWNMRTFAYVSRYYIVNHSKPTLQQVALSIFLEQVFKSRADIISAATQQLLMEERRGGCVRSSMIASAINLFSSMSVGGTQAIYQERFLAPFLQQTGEEYASYLRRWQKEYSHAPDFLEAINAALESEGKLCADYFPQSDRKTIMLHMESVLLDSPITIEKLLNDEGGFRYSLKMRDETLLKKYYQLFAHRESGMRRLSGILRQEIASEGEELSRTYSGEETAVDVTSYVNSMMQLQADFPRLLRTCFRLDFNISKAVRAGLEQALNGGVVVRDRYTGQSKEVPLCEWLAHYVHLVLQHDHSNIEVELDRVTSMLSYITEQDRFLSYTRDRMAERILFSHRKFNEAEERILIQGIRQRYDPSSTAYLEGMLSDYEASKSFDAEAALRVKGRSPPFALSLLVAKKGIWPSHLASDAPLILPSFITEVLQDLQRAYLEGTFGRVLTWSSTTCTAEVAAVYGKGATCTLCLSGVQALLLLAFNERVEWSCQELMELYGLSEEQLRLTLPPLLKGRVLERRGPTGRPVSPEDVIVWNAEYKIQNRKVRLPPTLVQVSVVRSEQLRKNLDEDRKPAIDACLVRVLKSRRVIEHADLVEQCQQLLEDRFSPEVRLIKLRIEELLRKEYIEREPPPSSKYRYLA